MRTELFNIHPMKIGFFRTMRAFARTRVRAGMRLLDVASNDFRMAYLFPGVDYVGADLDPDMLRKGQTRHPGPEHNAVCCDIRSLPFPDGCFDAVISTHTLIHVPSGDDRDIAVLELLRVLKPGGDLVVNMTYWPVWVDRLEGRLTKRFDRVERIAHRRAFMAWWENRIIKPCERGPWPLRAYLGLIAPVIHVADRFGAPTMNLLRCEGFQPED